MARRQTGKQKMMDDIDEMVKLAQRSRGWAFREYPPQRAKLRGNCELIVIPAWLWRPRPRLQLVRETHRVIPLRRAG